MVFLALIPKKNRAKELRDYRSISLISSIYKIISKTLAERMKKVIEKIVSKHQMAFIKGRQIIDLPLLQMNVLMLGRRLRNLESFVN
uniref:Putative ovule protein n=1 Tax=Solanum chacoense TaxID=4108 RepID=A0A0V0HSB7_SOLCH